MSQAEDAALCRPLRVGRNGCPAPDDQITDPLESLPRATRAELAALWRTHIQPEVPRGLSRALMARAVAWALQAERMGGFSTKTRRRLDGLTSPKSSTAPSPGARLIREWNGETHEVIVLEQSFVYRGRTYSSLTAIAREITGAKWSGPRFFGLKTR